MQNIRIIDEQTFAELIKILASDPKVAVFQKLILSAKAELREDTKEIKIKEVEK